ncbi:hypothetical protein Tco_0523088 [Tanacetum coccineum]
MMTLQFADTHNLVAFLSKPTESEGFEQIVDFLNANPIRYILTINPTIYTSCVEQFWATVKSKTVNGEDISRPSGWKKIIITESIVRRDLQLEDVKNLEIVSGKFLMYPRALALETTKTTQAMEITSLKRRQEAREEVISQELMGLKDYTSTAELKECKTKADKHKTRAAKGHVTFMTVKQAPTPTVSSQQPSQVKVQDKGKGKMVKPEPVKKMSKKELLRLDEELAFKLQAEEEEEERLAREKAQQVEEANIAWDDVQAKINVDYQLAQDCKLKSKMN